MKHLVFILFAGIFIGLGIFAGSCNLKMIDDVECKDFVANFQIDKSNFPCYPDTCMVTFTSLVTGGIVIEYDWTLGNGTNTKEAFTHTYSDPGDYSVRLSVTSDDGCKDDTIIVVSIDNPQDEKPIAEFSPADTMGTAHFTVRFRNLSFSPTTATYLWNFGDNSSPSNTSNAAEPTHTYEKAGTYPVTLITTNDKGADTVAGTVVVKPRTFAKTFDIDPVTVFEERVLAIEENTIGEFNFVMNNTQKTWVSKTPYDGSISTNLNIIDLGIDFQTQTLEKSKKTASGYHLIGNAKYVGQVPNNLNFYFLDLGNDFAVKHKSGEIFDFPSNGDELGQGVCETSAGGYLLCGNKFSGSSTGAFIAKLNQGYIVDKRANLFTDDPSGRAYDAVETTANYTVLARIRNSASSKKETCIIRLDKTQLTPIGDPTFLGEITPVQFIIANSTTLVVFANANDGGKILSVNISTGMQESLPITIPNVTIKSSQLDAAGHLIIAGSEGSAPVLLKYDRSTGSQIWKHNYLTEKGISGEIFCVAQTQDSGYILGGLSNSTSLIIRTDSSGKVD